MSQVNCAHESKGRFGKDRDLFTDISIYNFIVSSQIFDLSLLLILGLISLIQSFQNNQIDQTPIGGF